METKDIKTGQIWELNDQESWNLPSTILILDDDVLGTMSANVSFSHIRLVSILKYEFGSITVIDEKINTLTAETILKLYTLKQDTPFVDDDEDNEDLEEENELDKKRKLFNQFGNEY